MHSHDRIATLRVGTSTAIAIITWALLAWFTIDLLVRGTVADYRHYLPWLALTAWVVWLVFFRARVEVRRDTVTSFDMLRTFELPYERINDIQVGGSITIRYTDAAGHDRVLRPWNAPGYLKLRRAGDSSIEWGGELAQVTVGSAPANTVRRDLLSPETAHAMNERRKPPKDLRPRHEPVGALLKAWRDHDATREHREARVTFNWHWGVAGALVLLGVML